MDLLSLFEVGPLKSGGMGEPAGQRQAMMIDAAEGCRGEDGKTNFYFSGKRSCFRGFFLPRRRAEEAETTPPQKPTLSFPLFAEGIIRVCLRRRKGELKEGGSAFHFQPPLVGSKNFWAKRKQLLAFISRQPRLLMIFLGHLAPILCAPSHFHPPFFRQKERRVCLERKDSGTCCTTTTASICATNLVGFFVRCKPVSVKSHFNLPLHFLLCCQSLFVLFWVQKFPSAESQQHCTF